MQKVWDRLVANVKGEGGLYRLGLMGMMVGSLQPREGRNTGRRVETVRVATVWDDGTEATRAATGRLMQTWGLWSGRGNVVGRDEGRWVGDN